MAWTQLDRDLVGFQHSRQFLAWENYLNAVNEDAERDIRLAKQRCMYCWYISQRSVAGQGFTDWLCSHCGHMGSHHNTYVPTLCRTCAIETAACEQCGGNLD